MAKMATARIAAAAAIAVLPLLVARPQQQRAARQGEDEETVTERSVISGRFEGPTLEAATALVDRRCERGDPALARSADGRAWLVFVEQLPGAGDRLVAHRLDASGAVDGAPIAVTRDPAPISAPSVVADGAGLAVFWTQLVDGVGQLFFSSSAAGTGGDGGSFSVPQPLTSGPLQRRRVVAAQHHGSIWLAYEEWTPVDGGRGSFDVWLAPFADGRLGARVHVGDGRFGDHDPQIASSGGEIAVAWSRYEGRDEEIFLRRFAPATGELDAPLNVSANAAADDVHPALAAAGDGALWLAWDERVDALRGRSVTRHLAGRDAPPPVTTARVACVRGREVSWPARRDAAGKAAPDGELHGIPLVALGGAHPRLAVTSDGRVHVASRALEQDPMKGEAFAFVVLLHEVDANGIGPPCALAPSRGWAEPAALLADGSALLAAWQRDGRVDRSSGDFDQGALMSEQKTLNPLHVLLSRTLGPSAIGVARIDAGGGPAKGAAAAGAAAASAPRVERLSPPHSHPSPDPVADPIVSGADHFVVARGSERYSVFWGDLHRHSNYSRCSNGDEMSPEDRWTFGRDVGLYDFMALTDHSAHVGPREWWRLYQLCELENVPGSFCALAGFEWSTRLYGHHNVILRGALEPYLSSRHGRTSSLPNLYATLAGHDAVTIPHTPADWERRVDFGRCDPAFSKLVEIFQAARGNYEFDGCFRQSKEAVVLGDFAADAPNHLDVGFVASSDHGDGCAYACALAPALDRDHLFDALRARRTYGATVKGILVDLRVDDALMGESVVCAAPPRIHAKVHGAAPLAEVTIFKDGRAWRTAGRHPPAAGAKVEASLEIAVDGVEPPPKELWRLRVSGAEVVFKPSLRLRYADPTTIGGAPHWRTGEGDGVFAWPAGGREPLLPDLARIGLVAPRDAKLTITQLHADEEEHGAGGEITTSLADLIAHGVSGQGIRGAWRLTAHLAADQDVDLGHGLGVADFEQEWSEESAPAQRSWYYLRAIQSDGELAWSSPIYVAPPQAGAGK
jgi:hypothetical protein